MSEEKSKFRWVPHIIRHDFWRKFFALIFAMLVTATVYSDKRKHEDEVFVIHNVQPALTLESGFVWKTRNLQQVSLTVRGPKTKLFDLKPEDFSLDYVIGEQAYQNRNENGRQYVTLKAEDVRCRHPKGALLQVLEVSPAEYTFTIDKIVTRELPLKAEYAAEDLPKGYTVRSITFPDEKKIKAVGPEHLFRKGMTVNTMPIPLKDHVADFTTSVRLHPIDGLSFSTDQVTVSVKLKKTARTEIRGMKVSLMLPPEQSGSLAVEKIEPATVKATVTGEKNTVENLKPEDLLIYADLSNITSAGTYKDVPLRYGVLKPGVEGISAVFISPLVIPEITVVDKAGPLSPALRELIKPEEKKAEEKKPEEKATMAGPLSAALRELIKPEEKKSDGKKPEEKKK